MIEAGVDEAGRGPLAGPVFAAAVILDKKIQIEGLNDSKKISEEKRESIAQEIKEKAIAWSIGISSSEEIDEVNILNNKQILPIQVLKNDYRISIITGAPNFNTNVLKSILKENNNFKIDHYFLTKNGDSKCTQ